MDAVGCAAMLERVFTRRRTRQRQVQAILTSSSPRYTDDFGKELMLANKRKYQLESRVKQIELELKESQQQVTHLAESLKSSEKLLWLEKERSATLEMDREKLNDELAELRRNGDSMRRELEAFRGEGGPLPTGAEHREELERVRADCDQRVVELREMKNKVEWRLGEVTQLYHDTKWRLGEVEATLAHRDWQLEQANNRIKQLEGSLSASDSAKVNDELNTLRAELAKQSEERSKLEWRLGEVSQWWNDAKWRVGELETETKQRSNLLDQAHHKIGELQRRLEGNAIYSSEDSSSERAILERKVAELDKAFNDSQWKVGELKAELGHANGEKGQLMRALEELREQNSKLEWHLGEVNQWWNDAKWKISELEDALKHVHPESGQRLASLEADNKRLQSLLSDGTFLIRKQPQHDRHKWKLLTKEDLLDKPLRRVWFEANEANEGAEIFLIGSFLNWECAIRCEPMMTGQSGRRGIWVDLPPGRHEFNFIRGGKWHTADKYDDCWNQHGTKNNWIFVE